MEAPVVVRARRDLTLTAAGAAVSEFGNALSLLVLVFWATPISPLLVAAILIAELLPFVLGAPLAGVLVDRFPNRRLLIIALVFQGIAISAIVPLMGQPVFVVALVLLSGCGRAIAQPCISALVPHIAGEEQATRGYAWLSTGRSLGSMAGVTGGALLAGIFGHPAALLIDGGTFLAYAALLAFVRSERRPSAAHEARPSALAGIRHVRRDAVLFTAVIGLSFCVGAVVVVNVADPAFVRYVLHGDEFVLGAMQACWMTGILVGNRIAARLETVSWVAYAIAVAAVTTGVGVLIPATFPFLVTAGIGWLVGGVSNGVHNVALNAVVRLRTPDEMRGRAFAAVGSMVIGANLAGTAAAGGLLLFIGPRAVFALGGTGALLSGVACLVFVRRALKREESPAEAELSSN
ncbi:MFS transporter [Lentzea sp. NPDC102401]|uniref:MFS transporter n=1 Tax=Lentzea sp. NPDC102401 TaxID=3364128 RepID=UPI003808BE9E